MRLISHLRYIPAILISGQFAYALEAEYVMRSGLTGGNYLSSSGKESSSVYFYSKLYPAGPFVGYSSDYVQDPTGSNKKSLWISGPAGPTHRLGLFDNNHTGSSGEQRSQFLGSNTASGLILGSSDVYIDHQYSVGNTLWIGNASGALQTVGLYSGEYMDPVDDRNICSAFGTLTESGYICGHSKRYVFGPSGNVSNGQSAWIAKSGYPTGAYRVGLTLQNEFQKGWTSGSSVDHSMSSRIVAQVSDGGYAAGYSVRYLGGEYAEKGQKAWISRGTYGDYFTAAVGFYDAKHTRSSDGYQFSETTSNTTINGRVAGVSTIYSPGGSTAWIANRTDTVRVGPTGSIYIDPSGYELSRPVTKLTESGFVAGYSRRYIDGAYGGTSAWKADHEGNTQLLGLVDAEYTSSTGRLDSEPVDINEEGVAVGWSERYSGGTSGYRSIWISDVEGNTKRIGLDGATIEHSSVYGSLRSDGYVAGYSPDSNKTTAWIANAGGVTRVVGMYRDLELDGMSYKDNQFTGEFTESGFIAGYAERFKGKGAAGRRGWVADLNGRTLSAASSDSIHTIADTGYQYSEVSGITESGYAWGYSKRYNGDESQEGSTAFVLNLADGKFNEIVLSVRASDGYAASGIRFVTEEGMAIGSYQLFDAAGVSLGSRAFVWDRFNGARDLGEALPGTAADYWWDYLFDAGIAEGGRIVALGYIEATDSIGVAVLNVSASEGLPVFTREPSLATIGRTGRSLQVPFRVEDGQGSSVSVTTSQALPGGLSLTSDGSGDWVIAGSPTEADVGTHPIQLIASNSVGSMTMDIVIRIIGDAATPPPGPPGDVVTWGDSAKGGDSSAVSGELGSNVLMVTGNKYACAALKSDGSVVTWGFPSAGGDSSGVSEALASGVASISNTYEAFAALKLDGSVVTWGQNPYGGNSSAVTGMLGSGVVSILGNREAFAALKDDGSVVTWGSGPSGGNSSSVATLIASGVERVFTSVQTFAALKSDGSVVTWGSQSGTANSTLFSGLLSSGVVEVFAGETAFVALKSDGSAVVWGSSTSGGLPVGVAGLDRGVIDIAFAERAVAAIRFDGSVVTWGYPDEGGDSSSVVSELDSGVVRIFSTDKAFAALKNDGSVVTWGYPYEGGDSSSVSGDLSSGVVTIVSNSVAFAALKNDGSVVTWGGSGGGGNSSSVLGLNSGIQEIVAAKSGAFAALKLDGSVVTWGSPTYGGDSSSVADIISSGVNRIYSNDSSFAALGPDLFSPEISVEEPEGAPMVNGASIQLGFVAIGDSVTRTFTIRNEGTEDLTGLSVAIPPGQTNEVFINEIHYSNAGTDGNEFVEVAGPAGTDLTGWQLVFYNGFNNNSYDAKNLLGVIPDEGGGFGAIAFPVANIQNGASDGVALYDSNRSLVLEFLSYEGVITAGDGVAAGLTSIDVGVAESDISTPIDHSIQRSGTGVNGHEFSWLAPSAASPGVINVGQVIQAGGSGDFAVDIAGMLTTVTPTGSTKFVVIFSPSVAGNHAATLQVISNDSDKSPFEITLIGEGETPEAIFDSFAALAGLGGPGGSSALPDAIPFNDGVKNILKYAFNMNLSGPDSATLTPDSGTSGLPTYELDDSGATTVVRVQYIRRTGSGLVYTPMKSENLLTGSFELMNGTETSETLGGGFERVTVVAPCDPATEPSCFWRVRVTLP